MPLVLRNKSQVELPLSQLTAEEYQNWTQANPEEVAKMDEPVNKLRAEGRPFKFVNGRPIEVAITEVPS